MPGGRLFDGRSAQDRPVLLTIHDDALAILDPAGDALLRWPVARIVRTDPDAPGPRVTLRMPGEPARLVIEDQALLDRLADGGARLRGTLRWTRRRWTGIVAGLAGSVVLAAVLVDRLPTLLLPLVPHALERSWSAGIESTLALSSRRCTAPAGRAALSGLIATLSGAAGIDPPRFTVLDDPGINAFTLPDGRVLILRGLIERASDPEQLAGVLAHELGHAAHRDPTREMLRHLELSLLARSLGWSSDLGGRLTALSYGRQAEARADASAIVTLRRAGLRADGLGRFLASLGGGTTRADFLSDHPSNAARVAVLPHDHDGRSALTPPAWRDVRSICDR